MNTKPNYNEGSARNIIIKLLCVNGVIPYNLLKWFPFNTHYAQYIIKDMQKEDILEVTRSTAKTKRRSKKLVTFRDYEKNKELFEAGLPADYQMLYEDVKYRSKNARFGQLDQQERIYRLVEADLFFFWAGIPSVPDTRKTLEYFSEAATYAYYSIQEIKRASSYTDTVEELPEKDTNKYNKGKKVTGSKAAGLYISPANIFTVYNSGKNPIRWIKAGEQKLKLAITLAKRGSDIDKTTFDSCIILYSKDSLLEIYIKGEEENDSYDIGSLGRIYENIYFIPTTELGRKMLQIIGHPSFRQKIINLILSPDEITTNVKTDGFNKSTKETTLFAGITSIDYLYSFYIAASVSKDRNDGAKYVLVCFEEQEEFFSKIFKEIAEVKTVNIDDVIEAAGFEVY